MPAKPAPTKHRPFAGQRAARGREAAERDRARGPAAALLLRCAPVCCVPDVACLHRPRPGGRCGKTSRLTRYATKAYGDASVSGRVSVALTRHGDRRRSALCKRPVSHKRLVNNHLQTISAVRADFCAFGMPFASVPSESRSRKGGGWADSDRQEACVVRAGSLGGKGDETGRSLQARANEISFDPAAGGSAADRAAAMPALRQHHRGPHSRASRSRRRRESLTAGLSELASHGAASFDAASFFSGLDRAPTPRRDP